MRESSSPHGRGGRLQYIVGDGAGIAQEHHRALGMCQNLKNCVLAGQIVEGSLAFDSEHDQAGLAFGRRGQDFNQTVTVHNARLNADRGAAAG